MNVAEVSGARRVAATAARLLVLLMIGSLITACKPLEEEPGSSNLPRNDPARSDGHESARSPESSSLSRDPGRRRSEQRTRAATRDERSGGRGASVGFASALLREPIPDRDDQDSTPAYAEAIAASIESRGSRIRMKLSFEETLPPRMAGSREVFVAGFGVKMGDDAPVSVFALGDETGWHAFISYQDDQRPLRTFSVADDHLVFTVAWSDLGGVRRFRWRAYSTLVEQVAGRAHPMNKGVDRIPNVRSAAFPEA